MIRRDYDAIVLDLDGTLVDDADHVRPRSLSSLRSAAHRGVRVMVATGRSELATVPVLSELALDTAAVVYNGAAVYCPVQGRLIEERVLSERALERALSFGLTRGCLVATMCAGVKFALTPRDEVERLALRDFTGLRLVGPEGLWNERVIRVTLFSAEYATSAAFAEEVEAYVDRPVYMTHFPLNALPNHRESRLLVVDIHPPCRGKAEALRVLEERYSIQRSRVVAVGDATNDIAMVEAAGLGVAMQHSMPDLLSVATRVIGSNNSDAIADLVEELFP